MSNTRKIAVIGAGLAGISAASALVEAGVDVTLFERDSAVGGRLGDVGKPDLGAQYFTVRHPAFRQATREWQQRGWIAEWSPRLYHYDHAHGLRASADDIQRLVGIPDMATLAEHLLGSDPVCDSEIQQIQRTADEHWLLQTADGTQLGPFTGLVLATAPATAALLLEAAPQVQQDVARVRMRPCWSLALRFANPLGTVLDACFVRDGPLDWLARNNSKPQRPADELWVAQSTASWAEEHQHASPELVASALQQAMAEVLGVPLPEADQVQIRYWPQARPAEELKWGALAAPKLGLYVCGDWCLGGRIENAWLSGRQAAKAVLDK